MSTLYGLPSGVLNFQYMQEGTGTTTRGIFSTGTTAVFIGQNPQLGFGSDLGTFMNYVNGSRDAAHALHSVHMLQLPLTFPACILQTMTFLKRGINLADGIQYTFSGCLRETIAATTNYLKLKGCLIAAGAFGIAGSEPLQAQTTLVGNLSAYDSNAPTNWSFAAVPTTAPYLSSGMGTATSITVRDVDTGVNYTPDVRSWAVGFNNGIAPIPHCGADTFADFIPTQRGLQVSLSINKKDLNIWGIHNLHHDTNIYISISTPGVTFTGTGGLLDPAQLTFSSDSPNIEVYTMKCKVGSLAAA